MTHHKTKPKQKKAKKTQNPSSINLFTFVVLLIVNVAAIVIIMEL
jgi:hypothetical protein